MAEVRSEIAWSWSRHRTLRECARKYYWQYYGSWGGRRDDAAPRTRLADRLKRLTTFDQLVGIAVHRALARALLHRPAAASALPAERLAGQAEALFQRACEEGELAEEYYGLAGIAERRAAAEGKLAAAIAGVRASAVAHGLFARPKARLRWVDDESLPFEERRVRLGDAYLFYGAPDVAIADAGGAVHVIDWKTGRRAEGHRLQLAAYALFLSVKLPLALDRFRGHVVYLLEAGEAHRIETPCLSDHVPAVLEMVTDLYADVRGRLTDVAANVAGDIERFPMTGDRALCARCNFRELCGRL